MIKIIDYGMGNLRSVEKAFQLYTNDVEIIHSPAEIEKASALVLPGDGAFGMAMHNIRTGGWLDPLKDYIYQNKPFLGICLGYQLLFDTSEEFGHHQGLGIIKGKVIHFKDTGLKIPHMGWNQVKLLQNNIYLDGIEDNSFFYFIHTYHPVIEEGDWIIGECEYGYSFPCIAGKGNVLATQFHPEKSHNVGLKIIENFVRKTCV